MKKIGRRKFLLFASQIGLVGLIGCDSGCNSRVNYPGEVKFPIKADEELLKNTLSEILDSGKKLTLNWNCGGDEAMIDLYIDENYIEYTEQIAMHLSLYLVNYLNLPSIGEFSMEGKGEIKKDKELFIIEFESIMLEYADYDDQGNYLGNKKVNEIDKEYSGNRELFK